MDSLKRSLTGKYNADDVDELLLKVRNDYEKCLREQKNRIMALRDENREMQTKIEKYKANEIYIIDTIAQAEEAAESIVGEATKKAREIIETAQTEDRKLRSDVEVNCQRLFKLKRASEAIFRSVAKVMGEHIDVENVLIQNNIKPFSALTIARRQD